MTAAADAAPPDRPWPCIERHVLDWLSTTDHKRIGMLYIVTAFAFFAIGGLFALRDAHRAGGNPACGSSTNTATPSCSRCTARS